MTPVEAGGINKPGEVDYRAGEDEAATFHVGEDMVTMTDRPMGAIVSYGITTFEFDSTRIHTYWPNSKDFPGHPDLFFRAIPYREELAQGVRG